MAVEHDLRPERELVPTDSRYGGFKLGDNFDNGKVKGVVQNLQSLLYRSKPPKFNLSICKSMNAENCARCSVELCPIRIK